MTRTLPILVLAGLGLYTGCASPRGGVDATTTSSGATTQPGTSATSASSPASSASTSGSAGPSASSPASSPASTGTPPIVGERTGLRGVRYCEIIVVKGRPGKLTGLVYNTIGLNDCPAAQWKAIDPEALKKELEARAIVMNGPRYFMMDTNALTNPGAVAKLGGIEMRALADVELPFGALLGGGDQKPYSEVTVARDTRYIFSSGREVYELVSPAGNVYVMQSFSQIDDESITEASLPKLGERLKLPEGWLYRVRVLEQDYVVKSGGEARVVQDDLGNTYQRVEG